MATSRKRVLWVDDEIEFLRSHIMFLETRGYSVTPVMSGDDAIHVIHNDPRGFDIVLLDEQMMGKDGLTTLEEIKDFIPDLPVVMVTKSEEESLMEDAMGRRIDGYLTKPVNPSQILSVCKKLLDSRQILSSQTAQRFGRNYSEIRTLLQKPLDARQWAELCEHFVKWDFELETVEDEGVRQAHAGQKSDANALFSNFVIGTYVRWTQGQDAPPLLTPNILAAHVVPRLRQGGKVYLLVFDSMRLDQFMAIEPLLKKIFTVERGFSYAVMPTAPPFTRKSLFSGLYPDDVAARYPGIRWEREEGASVPEERLLRDALTAAGAAGEEEIALVEISDTAESARLPEVLAGVADRRLVAIVVNFITMLIQNRTTSAVLQQIAPDEEAFRRLTQSWFQYSDLYQALKKISEEECTVVAVSCNGSVLATRGTELFGGERGELHGRYRFGERITCDERHALFISEPARFRMPAATEKTAGIILKENFYFIRHDKFENYPKQYQNIFEHGGISMEEMILPLAVLRPLIP